MIRKNPLRMPRLDRIVEKDLHVSPPQSRQALIDGVGRRQFLRSMMWSLPAFALSGTAVKAGPSRDQIDNHLINLTTQVDFRSRSSWTVTPPRLEWLQSASRYSRVTIHHAGMQTNHHMNPKEVAADIDNILAGHRARQFGDIGYHFIVDRAGSVWEGRSLKYTGAHVSAQNDENIGIMLLGNFENQRPSGNQMRGLYELVHGLRLHFGIPSDLIYGHRDLGQTLCPGRYLYGYVREMRET